MTDPSIAQELRSLRETVLMLCRYIGPRLTRAQVCERLGVERSTLARRIEQGACPRPGPDGKWLLSEVVEWESRRATSAKQ